MNRKLRKGDQVLVIKGNDSGKVGKILLVRGEKFIVEGINVRKKHKKKTREDQKGQIIDIEMPIHRSNVKPSVEGKGVKLRVEENEEGQRELYYLDGNRQRQPYRSVKNGKGK